MGQSGNKRTEETLLLKIQKKFLLISEQYFFKRSNVKFKVVLSFRSKVDVALTSQELYENEITEDPLQRIPSLLLRLRSF